MSNLSSEEHYEIYKNIEARVRERFERRKEFFSHMVAFAVFMAGMWAMVGFGNFAQGLWGIIAAVITIGWGMGAVIHFIQYTLDEMGERAIAAELQKAGLGIYQHPRSKRKIDNQDEQIMRLGEDGELVEMRDDYDDEPFYDEARS